MTLKQNLFLKLSKAYVLFVSPRLPSLSLSGRRKVISRILFLLFFASACATSQNKNGKANSQELHLDLARKEDNFNNPVEIFKNSDLDLSVRQKAARQMIQEDKPGSVNILFQVSKAAPKLLSKGIVSYFGEKKYLLAIPIIKKTLELSDNMEFIYSSFYALAQMERDEVDKYILHLCNAAVKRKNLDYQHQCLLAIHDTRNKTLKRKAIPVFKVLYRVPKMRASPKLRKLISDFLRANRLSASFSRKTPTPGKFLVPKARSTSSSGKKTKTPRVPASFSELRSVLAKRVGRRNASILLKKVDLSLKEHTKNKSDVRDFLVRSYRRHYGKKQVDPQKTLILIQKGLRYPGSLKAVVKNLKREYQQPPLRTYALSKIFKISRSQAELLLSL